MWTLIAILTAAFWIPIAVTRCWQMRNIARLSDQPETGAANSKGEWPSVRIVIAARNEARDIEPAVRSVLAMDYPKLDIVAVNDRSSDATGAILDRLSREFPHLTVRHINELPDHWLGKNHALHVGAKDCSADWLLFTDADVRFHPKVLHKAIAFSKLRNIDHLACFPTVLRSNWVLTSIHSFFALAFTIYMPPFKAADPRSPAHTGIGAFNLIRTPAYHLVGGHKRIALRPDDDIKLGKIIKQAGFRQMFVSASEMLTLHWYRSTRETIVGLEKNSFAGLDYSVGRVLIILPFFLLLTFTPLPGLIFAHGLARLLFLASLVCLGILVFYTGLRLLNAPLTALIGFPLGAALFIFILIRAVALTLWRDGIVWRDHYYPLQILRSNRV